jgi:hypothetical protein
VNPRKRAGELIAAAAVLVLIGVVTLAAIYRHTLKLGFGDFPTWVLGLVAVAVALFGEWRTSVRVADERKQAATDLAEERKAADTRLARQLEHSTAQLQAEHDLAREQEQLDQAYAVVVVLGERAAEPVDEDVGDPNVRTLVLMITNKGKYTITRVEAQFSPDGQRLHPARHQHAGNRPRQAPGRSARRPARQDRVGVRQRAHAVGRRNAF